MELDEVKIFFRGLHQYPSEPRQAKETVKLRNRYEGQKYNKQIYQWQTAVGLAIVASDDTKTTLCDAMASFKVKLLTENGG